MKKFGKIIWHDLTVENAEQVRDFYHEVVGWTFSNVSMGDHNDFNMMNSEGEVVAGVCHKRGMLAGYPSQWLNYVTVENLNSSIETCKSLGGKVVQEPTSYGTSKFAVIRDPAGAYLALAEEADSK